MGIEVARALMGARTRADQAAVVGVLFRRTEDAHLVHALMNPTYRDALDAASGRRMELCVTHAPQDAEDARHIDTAQVVIRDRDDLTAIMVNRQEREETHYQAYRCLMDSGQPALMTYIPAFSYRETLAICQLLDIDPEQDFPCVALLFPVTADEVLHTVVPVQGDSATAVFNSLMSTLQLVGEVVDGFNVENRKNAESLHREVRAALDARDLRAKLIQGARVIQFIGGFVGLALDLKNLPVRHVPKP